MNPPARTVTLEIAALLVSISVYAQTPAPDFGNPAKRLLAEVIDGEKLPDSGRLCFRITIQGNPSSDLMAQEAAKLDRVVYSWAPGGKFSLALVGDDGPVRTIVSDGKAIDTGEKIWDARFAFGYTHHESEENFNLERELENLMWPYSHAIYIHLHPISGFKNLFTVDSLSAIYDMSIADDLAPPDAAESDSTLKLRMSHLPEEQEVLNIRKEAIAFVRASQRRSFAGPTPEYERTGLTRVEGVGWVPARCSSRIVDKDGQPVGASAMVSELCPEQPDPTVNPAEFVVDYDKSPMIPWPHGSRMKNFLYGIVNIFKDAWEGISDGVLGD